MRSQVLANLLTDVTDCFARTEVMRSRARKEQAAPVVLMHLETAERALKDARNELVNAMHQLDVTEAAESAGRIPPTEARKLLLDAVDKLNYAVGVFIGSHS